MGLQAHNVVSRVDLESLLSSLPFKASVARVGLETVLFTLQNLLSNTNSYLKILNLPMGLQSTLL